MKTLNLIIFLILSLGSLSTILAQVDTTAIPLKADVMMKSLEEIMEYQNREESLKVLDEFKKNVKTRRITDQHYQGIYVLGNAMVKRKMKRYTYFRHLLATVNTFAKNNNLSTKYFDNWIQLSIDVLKDVPVGKYRAFESYLQFSLAFFNEGALYNKSKGGHTWKAESQDFKMSYENQQLKIYYTNTRLVCFNRKDSLTIINAKGVYIPLQEKWIGETGRVEWNQTGSMDAYCDIKDYTISTKDVEYSCDNAVLNYPSVFNMSIEGRLSDRIIKRMVENKDNKGKITYSLPVTLAYPRFESSRRDIDIEDIGEGVSYVGGFTMQGSVVKGYGSSSERSTVYIENKEGQQIAKIIAEDFDITRGERILSGEAEIVLYLHTDNGIDSLYHPNIKCIYDIKTRNLQLLRGESQESRVPFYNSLQEVEMNCRKIEWAIDTDDIKIGDNASGVEFDSESYFDKLIWEKYQTITTINPLVKFALYSEKIAQFNEENEENLLEEYLECERFQREEVPEEMRVPCEMPESVYGEPRTLHGDSLARLLDKRVEKLMMLTPSEMKEIEQNIKEKFGTRNYKNSPNFHNFMNTTLDVTKLTEKTSNPAPSHDLSNTLNMFLEMVKDGFAVYNDVDSSLTLRDKLFHYAKASNIRDTDHDYDMIRLKSTASKKSKRNENAVLNIKEGAIQTEGVQFFTLSDSQQVIAQPYQGKVKMKKGRDMDFDGILKGGFLNFTGEGFHFSYNNFDVFMDSINFIDIFIYERARNENGWATPQRMQDAMTGIYSTHKEPVNSVIEETTGLLLIDAPSNKSGRKNSIPYLPSFESLGKAKVFYDKRNRQGEGTYPRESFYYELEPFILDSLDKIDPDDLIFDGRLVSADIFPEVTEELRMMYHDLSLGFEAETKDKDGEEGYPIYLRENPGEGKGRFKGLFGVSNEGLIGLGRLNYLGATIESEYIEFLPELFRAEDVDSFSLEESNQNGVEYPSVAGEQVKIGWAPYSDSMHIESAVVEGVPFSFFGKDSFSLEGSLTLTPDGLLGQGIFDWPEARLESNPGGDFKFGTSKIESPSTKVMIRAMGEQGLGFENDNVDAVVDFEKQRGDFTSNEKDLSTDLPYNNYKTSLDRFHWDMATQHIFMDASEGKTGFFLATEQSQDSLFFLGEKADYDLNTGLLQIDGVDHIRVADAFIYPKDKHVEIEESAHMRTLTDSEIVADTSNKNHVIQRATINVLSRTEYKAEGFLEFDVEHQKQEIEFANIQVAQEGTGKYVTKGSGMIYENDSFYLDRRTRFKGEVKLSADSKNLTFKGFSKINSDVIPTQEWFEIDSRIDKKDVSIVYDHPKNPSGETLNVGLYLSMDSLVLYPAVLAPKKSLSDRGVFSTTGIIKYDSKTEVYLFGDSAKVLEDAMSGKLMTISEKNSKVVAEGRFDFNRGFNGAKIYPVKVDAIGTFDFFLNEESDYRFDMAMNLDFYLPSSLLDMVYDDLASDPDIVEKILYNNVVRNKNLERYMREFIPDEKKFDKMWKKVKEDERMPLPNDFEHTFFFSKLDMRWSDKTGTFVTKGPIQLASLGGKHLGQVLKGAVEIQMDATRGDVMNLYFESPGGDYYYFSYQNGTMMTTSSNPDYTAAVTSMKNKDKKKRAENGGSYEIIITNPAVYQNFRQRASNAH
ncbi:MAG: hypothetical protein MK212_00340 [Saprospiraceae bacterium]|nr:hypothetical protein [Saprospiraceae bacterium]